MDYSETKTPKLIRQDNGDRILALFQTQRSLENALSSLMLHGYSREEIVVKFQAEVAEKRYLIAGPVEDPDGVTFQKAVGGIKYGVLVGSIALGLVMAYLILFQAQMLQAGPLASILFAMSVGAVWGGTVGFIIGPLLPFSHLKSYELTLSKGQVLLSFQPKTRKDEYFFRSLNWPMYILAH